LLAITTIVLYARSWTRLDRLLLLRGYGYNFTGLASAHGRIIFESIRDRPSSEGWLYFVTDSEPIPWPSNTSPLYVVDAQHKPAGRPAHDPACAVHRRVCTSGKILAGARTAVRPPRSIACACRT
jgi:hypothetical protein